MNRLRAWARTRDMQAEQIQLLHEALRTKEAKIQYLEGLYNEAIDELMDLRLDVWDHRMNCVKGGMRSA